LFDDSGAFLLVRSLTRFAAKLMVKVPSANQPKSAATMVAPCLHDVTTDSRPCNEDELDSFQQTFNQGDLAGGSTLCLRAPTTCLIASVVFLQAQVFAQAVKWIGRRE
jgi:hypothetical protein